MFPRKAPHIYVPHKAFNGLLLKGGCREIRYRRGWRKGSGEQSSLNLIFSPREEQPAELTFNEGLNSFPPAKPNTAGMSVVSLQNSTLAYLQALSLTQSISTEPLHATQTPKGRQVIVYWLKKCFSIGM